MTIMSSREKKRRRQSNKSMENDRGLENSGLTKPENRTMMKLQMNNARGAGAPAERKYERISTHEPDTDNAGVGSERESVR